MYINTNYFWLKPLLFSTKKKGVVERNILFLNILMLIIPKWYKLRADWQLANNSLKMQIELLSQLTLIGIPLAAWEGRAGRFDCFLKLKLGW